MYKVGGAIFLASTRKYLSFFNKICLYCHIRIFLNLIFGPQCHDNIVLLKTLPHSARKKIVPDLELNIKG